LNKNIQNLKELKEKKEINTLYYPEKLKLEELGNEKLKNQVYNLVIKFKKLDTF